MNPAPKVPWTEGLRVVLLGRLRASIGAIYVSEIQASEVSGTTIANEILANQRNSGKNKEEGLSGKQSV